MPEKIDSDTWRHSEYNYILNVVEENLAEEGEEGEGKEEEEEEEEGGEEEEELFEQQTTENFEKEEKI